MELDMLFFVANLLIIIIIIIGPRENDPTFNRAQTRQMWFIPYLGSKSMKKTQMKETMATKIAIL